LSAEKDAGWQTGREFGQQQRVGCCYCSYCIGIFSCINSAFLWVIRKIVGEYNVSKKKNNINLAARKTRILVVDDHPIVRDGLTDLINLEADLVVSAEAGNAAEAKKAVRKQHIDLAIVDMLLKDTTGVQITKKIKAICPNLIVLIFSMSDELRYIKQAFEAGARGYITKDEISEDILNAIRYVLKGQIYMSDRLIKNIPKEKIHGLLTDKI
jgi:CheY-like chemotaxis protein